jgi:hypothetical protein
MSKLMSLLGVGLLAVGLVFGLLELMQPGSMQAHGIGLGTSIDLIVGGILAFGLGGVIGALQNLAGGTLAKVATSADDIAETVTTEIVEVAPAPDTMTAEEAKAEQPAPLRNRFGFGRKLGAAAATTTAAAGAAVAETAAEAVAPVVAETSSAVQETLDALEQAKQDVVGSLSRVESITETPAAEEPAAEAGEEAASEDELYVIEEKMIRGRPARILSDNTVEAETDEGWMRFENIEHLNEYLDAAGQ